mmetsp:Transcript_47663/g.137203  ORF Transcript_47663/g.137203 Transcript_47663/m.137203 type:complete len:205 (-) Transcript_47663:177-791(-)
MGQPTAYGDETLSSSPTRLYTGNDGTLSEPPKAIAPKASAKLSMIRVSAGRASCCPLSSSDANAADNRSSAGGAPKEVATSTRILSRPVWRQKINRNLLWRTEKWHHAFQHDSTSSPLSVEASGSRASTAPMSKYGGGKCNTTRGSELCETRASKNVTPQPASKTNSSPAHTFQVPTMASRNTASALAPSAVAWLSSLSGKAPL